MLVGTATYEGIGGNNMNSGISTYALVGSSAPGIKEDETGSTYNLQWTFPGGINNQSVGDGIAWGYALERGVGCTQADLEAWLKQEKLCDLHVAPTRIYTDEEIAAASDPQMADDINRLMKYYLAYVMDYGEITQFREGYKGCIIRGSY